MSITMDTIIQTVRARLPECLNTSQDNCITPYDIDRYPIIRELFSRLLDKGITCKKLDDHNFECHNMANIWEHVGYTSTSIIYTDPSNLGFEIVRKATGLFRWFSWTFTDAFMELKNRVVCVSPAEKRGVAIECVSESFGFNAKQCEAVFTQFRDGTCNALITPLLDPDLTSGGDCSKPKSLPDVCTDIKIIFLPIDKAAYSSFMFFVATKLIEGVLDRSSHGTRKEATLWTIALFALVHFTKDTGDSI